MRRPLSGALLGLVLGLAIAVILQQMGVWPLDRITVFLLPALVALLAILFTSIGRQGSTGTLITALVITIPLAVWGALGLGDIGEKGFLNGGCTVNATSDLDTTVVTDTSRGDPFRIAPQGRLDWVATSPVVFDDYKWKIWTEVGGIKYTLASEENQNNDGGSQENKGDVSNATEYGESRGVPMDEIRGVIIVGGGAAGTCDGLAFVSLEADLFETLVSQIALAIAILALIILMFLIFTGREAAAAAAGSAMADSGSGASQETDGDQLLLGSAGAGTTDGPEGDPAQELIDDITDAAEESGFGRDDD